jgi:hypothetical protein
MNENSRIVLMGIVHIFHIDYADERVRRSGQFFEMMKLADGFYPVRLFVVSHIAKINLI